MAEVE